MTSQHEDHTATRQRTPRGSSGDHLPEDARERADVQEDRRRQQDQDYAELGGES
jgi:hypothetical protein